ncbi:MAG: hypothetical protein EOP04_05605 [Proteobacteria bacterium]|nr:MAG: hypothetical protein EOP04_05605 [Pseudomonadota bacterium]
MSEKINEFNRSDANQGYTYSLFDKAMEAESTWGASIICLVWGTTVIEKRKHQNLSDIFVLQQGSYTTTKFSCYSMLIDCSFPWHFRPNV